VNGFIMGNIRHNAIRIFWSVFSDESENDSAWNNSA